jgi:hypothetical protein
MAHASTDLMSNNTSGQTSSVTLTVILRIPKPVLHIYDTLHNCVVTGLLVSHAYLAAVMVSCAVHWLVDAFLHRRLS